MQKQTVRGRGEADCASYGPSERSEFKCEKKQNQEKISIGYPD